MKINWKKKTILALIVVDYLYEEDKLKRLLKITGSSHDFASMSPEVKTKFLYDLTREKHASTPNSGNSDEFYSGISKSCAVLSHAFSNTVLRFTDRIQRPFVPKFYHDRKDNNFLKDLIYFGEKKEIDEKYFFEVSLFGRKLYEYRINRNKKRLKAIHLKNLDWPFPDKFYESIRYTIHGFLFKFKNLPNSLSSILNPSNNLTNIESNTEQAENNLTEELFPKKKDIEEKIAEYKIIPTTNFINESYFLHDKSNLIKKTICNCN